MSFKIEFTIPDLPKMPNQLLGSSRWARIAEKNKWRLLVRAAIGRQRPDVALSCATVTCIRQSSVEPDFDGLVGSFKYPIDALKFCRVIEDDKSSVIGQPSYRWEKASPGKGSVFIRVEARATAAACGKGETA